MQSRLAPQKRNPWISTKIEVTYVRFSVFHFIFRNAFDVVQKLRTLYWISTYEIECVARKAKQRGYDAATAANAHLLRNIIMFASDRTSCARL